jgi:predicted Zn-dependent peptidase
MNLKHALLPARRLGNSLPRRSLASLARLSRLLPVACCALLSCQSASPPAAAPTKAATTQPSPAPSAAGVEDDPYRTLPPEQRQQPPSAEAAPAWSFPAITDLALPSGLAVKLVQRSTLPIVRLQLVIRSGQASDGKQPGLAVLSGEMLKVGGTDTWTGAQLLDRIESLGSSFEVVTSKDATTLALSVTSDRFEEALELLGKVVVKPRFSRVEFDKLKRREMDRTSSLARTSAAWVSNMVLYRELFETEANTHPYATFDATSTQIGRLTLGDVRTWCKRHVTAKNSTLVIVGAVDPERALRSTERAFGRFGGPAAPTPSFAPLNVSPGREILLVDRPKSTQAEVRLAALGPEGASEEYPRLRVANQVLGGGVSGRLFLDVREQRSLAYSTGSSVERLAQGPLPVVLQAGTQTAKAGLALQALFEHSRRMVQQPPSADETQRAARYLSDLFMLRMESVGTVADMVAQLSILGLGNDYYDTYRTALSSTTAADAERVSRSVFGPNRVVVVVAGDAERLGSVLSHFGAVTVVNPERDFERVRVLPHDPNAAIELPRLDGT